MTYARAVAHPVLQLKQKVYFCSIRPYSYRFEQDFVGVVLEKKQ